jgi:hypothetical protein
VFTVSEASAESLLLVPPIVGPPGTNFRIGLAGFAPGSTVKLFLYLLRIQDGGWTFLAILDPATMDQEGQALFSLHTEPDDPPGRYRVKTDPPATARCTRLLICDDFTVAG